VELNEALAQISEIRERINRVETFRGYRSLTVGFTGLLAFAGAGMQTVWIPKPEQSITAYLSLWIGLAAASLVATGLEMTVRCRKAASPWTARLTWMAVEQFLPCVLAGGLLTFVIWTAAEQSAWMLPGLWAILFSLGVFASCRLLPRPIFWIGGFYLLAGGFCLSSGPGEAALSPWRMAATFGVGQILTAGILFFTLERNHGCH